MRGTTLGWRGDFTGSRQHLQSMIALYDNDRHHALTFKYGGLNPCTFAQAHAGFATWSLGYPEQALVHSETAVALAREIAHPVSQAHASVCAAWVNICCGDFTRARDLATVGRQTAVASQALYWVAFSDIFLSIALRDASQLRLAIEALAATGSLLGRTSHLGWLAEVYLLDGQNDEARAALDEALPLSAGGEHVYLAELHRLRGELTLATGGAPADAEHCLERAIEIAQQQAAKSWELRATMSLARLWMRNGRSQEARARLLEIYAWFTEGFATQDLVDAEALLAFLADSR